MKAFPRSSLAQSSFELYGKRSWVFELFTYLFLLNNVYTYTTNALFTSEIFESVPWVRALITRRDGVLCRRKIIYLRLLAWLLMVLFSLFTHDVIGVLNVSGSLFSPIVSYFGPVL